MDPYSYFKGIGRRHHPLRCFQSRMEWLKKRIYRQWFIGLEAYPYIASFLLYSSSIILIPSGIRFRFCSMNNPMRMVWRCIDGIKFYGFCPCIDQVMPGASGDKDGIILTDFTLEFKPFPACPHHNNAPASFQAKKLVIIRMHFQPNLSTRWYAHKRNLQMTASPYCPAIKWVSLCCACDVYDKRPWPKINIVTKILCISHRLPPFYGYIYTLFYATLLTSATKLPRFVITYKKAPETLCLRGFFIIEAPTRIELVIEVLQTFALPLGYGALSSICIITNARDLVNILKA